MTPVAALLEMNERRVNREGSFSSPATAQLLPTLAGGCGKGGRRGW